MATKNIKPGQATKRQPRPRVAAGGLSSARGFDAPKGGTYATYREIRANPTVALALAAIKSPVKAAPWLYVADDAAPTEMVKLVQKQMDLLKPSIVPNALRSLDYGWQSFERVWMLNAESRMVYDRAKPLAPDITEILIAESGRVVGVKNGEDLVGLRKSAVFTFDGEADDPYGRSIFENIRGVWSNWKDALDRIGKYITKNAGIIAQVEYPPEGRGVAADGSEKDNWEHAQTILDNLGRGNGVTIPKVYQSSADGLVAELIAKGIDPSPYLAWRISFLETKSGAGDEMLRSLQHFESLMVRGMLRPERSLLEGTNGTLAEAAVHTDTGLAISDEMHRLIVADTNRQFVEDLLVMNYGERARHAVRIEAGPLITEDKAFFRDLFKIILTNPSNLDLLLTTIDFDAALDLASLPKAAEVVTPPVPPPGPEQPTPAAAPAPPPTPLGKTAADLFRAVVAARARTRGG